MPLKLFEVNCRVRVKAELLDDLGSLAGKCGYIIGSTYGHWEWVVKLDNKGSYSFKEHELEMIHAED